MTINWSEARVLVFDTFFTDFEKQAINVDRLISDMKDARVNCLRLAAYSHLGYTIYPSNVTPMFPGLKHDLFREMVDRAHGENIAVIAYINAGFDAALPDSGRFGARLSSGAQKYWASDGPPWGVRWMCFNNPEYHSLLEKIIDEVMSYSVEGCYFDETAEGCCHCDICKKRYREETGREMPPVDHWRDEKLWESPEEAHEFMEYRKRVLLDWRKFLVSCTKKNGSDKLAMINCGGYPQPTANSLGASTVDTAPFIDGFLTESMLRAGGISVRHAGESARFADNAPFIPWVHVELKSSSWTFDVAPKDELMVKTGMLAAHGARPAAYTYHQNGQASTLRTLIPAYKRVADNEDVLSETTSAAEAGLLYHRYSHFAYSKNDRLSHKEFVGIFDLLDNCHLCFDIVDPEISEEAIAKYRLLVIPNAAIMTDREQSLLRTFIKGGGMAIISGECASRDRLGNPLKGSTLDDLLGCQITGRRTDSIPVNAGGSKSGRRCYFNINTDHPAVSGFEPNSWHPKSAQSIVVGLTTGKSLAGTVTCPGSPPVMGPGELLDLPSIVVNSCGKGRVVYLPWLVGGVYELDEPCGILELYRGVINWLLDGRKIIELNGPRSCEVSLRKKNGRYILHIIDYTGSHKILDEPGIDTISGKLRLPDGRQVKSIRAIDGKPIEWHTGEQGVIEFKAPIDRWQALVIE
jgi:hypothetical protein